MIRRQVLFLCAAAAWAMAGATPVAAGQVAVTTDPAVRAAFIEAAVRDHGLSSAEISAWLDRASYRQSIVDAMSRPAERVMPWHEYRRIFMTEARIADGRSFLAEHRTELDRVAAATGVPASYIVAILGVETFYGRITGTFSVLDALYTLGFHYPALGNPGREERRAQFFRRELVQSLLLAREEGIDIPAQRGSYAGAMGWGQFMPSSYRAYAKDGDGDGRRDLFASLPDVFASVANYFVAHGWEPGQPVVARALAAADATFSSPDLEPRYTPKMLAQHGFRPMHAAAHDLPATLVSLEGVDGIEHWFGYRNFYVITRYNRSPMYALAVHQLAEAIAADPAGSDAASATPESDHR